MPHDDPPAERSDVAAVDAPRETTTETTPNGDGPLPGDELPAWDSAELLRGQSEVRIVHQGMVYRLRVTRLGKLILHK